MKTRKLPSEIIGQHEKMMKVDVIICTKDRQHLLPKAVEQARTLISANNVIVVESSEKPNAELLEKLDVESIFTPNAKLGYARQAGLLKAETEYVVYLDDDLLLERNWFNKIMSNLTDEKVVVASGKTVYGWQTDPVIEKLFAQSKPGPGGAGQCVMRRKEILAIGGWDKTMHWGEDADLVCRVQRQGLKWIRDWSTKAYHRLTLKQYLRRAKEWGTGFGSCVKKGSLERSTTLFLRRFGSIIIMPFYYAIKCRDLRIILYYFLERLIYFAHIYKELKRE